MEAMSAFTVWVMLLSRYASKIMSSSCEGSEYIASSMLVSPICKSQRRRFGKRSFDTPQQLRVGNKPFGLSSGLFSSAKLGRARRTLWVVTLNSNLVLS